MRVKGFTLVEMMIVVALIGLLAAIAIPNWVHARSTSQTNACINNLQQIFGATQQWALENKAASTSTVIFANVQPYLKNSVICPAGGTTFANSYTLVNVSTKPVCQKVPATHALPIDTTS